MKKTLEEVLAALLRTKLAGRGIGSLAVRPSPAAPTITVWSREEGQIERAPKREPGFPAYSVTKTFMAALALQFVDQGRLDLEEPLARWFPNVDRAERITIRHLLGHRSGIPDYGGLPAYHEGVRQAPGQPWTFAEYAAHTVDRGLWFEPGTEFAYSNAGYMLLARILSEVGDDSCSNLIDARIVRPLGLERTYSLRTIDDLAHLAPSTSRQLDVAGTATDVRAIYHPGWVAHGVLASTASEILIFLDALFVGRVISPASLDGMTGLTSIGRVIPGMGDPAYGLGLMGDAKSGLGTTHGHNGSGPGYTASVFRAADLPGGPAIGAAMCGVEDGELAAEIVMAALNEVAERDDPTAGSAKL